MIAVLTENWRLSLKLLRWTYGRLLWPGKCCPMNPEKRAPALLICVIAIPGTTAFAQSPAIQKQISPPTFDVASVRSMTYSDDAPTHIHNPPRNSEFKAVNVTLRDLLEVAWEIPETQMAGGPAWASADKFDLEAKSDARFKDELATLSVEQGKEVKRQMLRSLLNERFKLEAHAEKRDMPIFALVIAKGGSRLVKTDAIGAGLSSGRGRISITGADDALAILAFELSWRLGRPVIDQTGLTGRYGITLNWTDEDAPSPVSGGSNGPSLFTAIQEQLGLKLVATKGPVPILVIDHAERPSEN
jgi:uncharacterized protein (TIGR03435 family)